MENEDILFVSNLYNQSCSSVYKISVSKRNFNMFFLYSLILIILLFIKSIFLAGASFPCALRQLKIRLIKLENEIKSLDSDSKLYVFLYANNLKYPSNTGQDIFKFFLSSMFC